MSEVDAGNQDELIVFNGINGADGSYGFKPIRGSDLAKVILGETGPTNLNQLKFKVNNAQDHFGVRADVDPALLDEAGWGIIFPANIDSEPLEDALKELLDWRKAEAGDLFKVFKKEKGYFPNDEAADFLERNGGRLGPANPSSVPYYLLIVGSPEQIPFEFQYGLDVDYATGRIAFSSLNEYASYARSVVTAEKGEVKLARQATIFAPQNEGDRATMLSRSDLIDPVLDYLKKERTQDKIGGWTVDSYLDAKATRSQLEQLLGGDQTPAMLFTATHGMEWPLGDPRQERHQGALLTADWPGPRNHRGEIPERMFMAGDHISSTANLHGMIAFFFACYGAGTPLLDDYHLQSWKPRQMPIASRPFLAQLPMKMLGHPKGGALAVVGHVERAWGYSFSWPNGVGSQTTEFESALFASLSGQPLGLALEAFGMRYASLSTEMSERLKKVHVAGLKIDPYELAGDWTAVNDARGYVILGDPAVRPPVAAPGEAVAERQALEPVTVSGAVPTPPPMPAVEEGETTAVSATSLAEVGSSSAGSDSSQPALEFGIGDTLDTVRSNLTAATRQLGNQLAAAIRDITTLEIVTYTSDELSKVNKNNLPATANMRALTRIELDGDVRNVIPVRSVESALDDGNREEVEIDRELWQIHREMVEVATQNKVEFLAAMGDIVKTLLEALKSS